jgi:hypothetical protein
VGAWGSGRGAVISHVPDEYASVVVNCHMHQTDLIRRKEINLDGWIRLGGIDLWC